MSYSIHPFEGSSALTCSYFAGVGLFSRNAPVALDEPGDTSDLTFAMEELIICSWCTPPPNVLQPLAALAVKLSELSLFHGGCAFPSHAKGPLEQIGPRLSILKLSDPFPSSEASADDVVAQLLPHRRHTTDRFSMSSFLASCTALK